jgi:hypothetical protein
MQVSGRKKAAPFAKSGGAWQFEVIAVQEMPLRRKVVVDRGML